MYYEELKPRLRAEPRTWLITGVAGFIGSNLLETLLKLDQHVVGLDNFATGHRHNLDEVRDLVDQAQWARFQFIEGDIRNVQDCHRACKDVDYVLHQAALGSVPRSIENPINTNATNIDGFLNMLVAARDAAVKRFVYAASSSTYGDHPGLPKVEENIGKPLSPYAVTKLVNELYAEVFARTYSFHSVGLRYFNVFGKRQDPNGPYAAVIPKWIEAMIKGEQIFINGDGETSRDFCFVENVIQANLLAATVENLDAPSQVYNVAVGDQTTLNQLFESLQTNLKEAYPHVMTMSPTFRNFRAGDVRHSRADIGKAKRLLGYEPMYRIDVGLKETVKAVLNRGGEVSCLSGVRMKKTILLVAMPDSIHVVRWIKQLADQEWDIHLFSSIGGGVVDLHPEMEGVTFHPSLMSRARRIGKARPRIENRSFVSRVINWLKYRTVNLVWRLAHQYLVPDIRVRQLLKVIRRTQPDLVHSMEIQAAGYLTLEAKKRYSDMFPSWLVTNWGSDIFLFGRLSEHKPRIREVLESCDYYSCECERDVRLARQFGFRGQVMPVFPNTGGFDLPGLEIERKQVPTSARRVIMLKGYQNWAGRALVGLRALSRCADILDGYSVIVYSANSSSPDVRIAAELFAEETGIPVHLVPNNVPHREILSLHGQARISIGLSISDAISTSLLEAMVMGSFPIQSGTACANEWIVSGVSGIIVPPEDPDVIEMAIRTALSDDRLVDDAARINWQTAQERLDGDSLKRGTFNMYARILQGADLDAKR